MKTHTFDLRCNLSGILVGKLEYGVVAGHMPWLSHWNGLVARHPLFSLPPVKLLAFMRAEWKRLAKASEDEQTTEYEDQLLRVGFLAVLHSLGSVDQRVPGLPTIATVHKNMRRLFDLAYWVYFLDSKRFRFPDYRVSKINNNSDFTYVGDYLDVCYEIRKNYLQGIDDAEEEQRSIAAERALKQLRDGWITPVSNKQLFRWVRAHLPTKYEPDAQGWLSTLFCGAERTILTFEKEDIALMSGIITAECPAGTGVMKAVQDRLKEIQQVYVDNREAFDVDFSDYEEAGDDMLAAVKPTQKIIEFAPKRTDFITLADFIRANALYYLQQRAKSVGANNGQAPI